MLQHAAPSAAQPFQRPVFAGPFSPPPDNGSGGGDIPRPPSAAARHSSGERPRHVSFGSGTRAWGDSSLSTLALLAANAPAAATSGGHPGSGKRSGESPRRSALDSSSTAMSQNAPAATAGYGTQNGSAPPICANCQTSVTPLWRRDESGSVLCNACGLFLKLHGRPRPISLKSDVIKSRNRVKTSQPKKRDSQGGQNESGLVQTNGYAAAHHEAARAATLAPGGMNGHHQHGLPMGSMTGHVGEPSPGSRSNTPSLHQQHSAHSIAPQHIFDTVALPPDPSVGPAADVRPPSPAPTANGTASHLGSSPNYDELVAQTNTLRTRVSELEVINDLFRGRVSELEASEQDARQQERSKAVEAQHLRAELATANARAADLERRLRESEDEAPARKKARTESDGGRDSTGPGTASPSADRRREPSHEQK